MDKFIAISAQKLNLKAFNDSKSFPFSVFHTHIILIHIRFDPSFHQTTNSRRNTVSSNTRTKKKKKSSKKKTSSRSTATKERRRRRRRSPTRKDRKQSDPVPRPKFPRPTSWSPKRRFLADEPIPKVIKH